jgi:hypothetical protein
MNLGAKHDTLQTSSLIGRHRRAHPAEKSASVSAMSQILIFLVCIFEDRDALAASLFAPVQLTKSASQQTKLQTESYTQTTNSHVSFCAFLCRRNRSPDQHTFQQTFLMRNSKPRYEKEDFAVFLVNRQIIRQIWSGNLTEIKSPFLLKCSEHTSTTTVRAR